MDLWEKHQVRMVHVGQDFRFRWELQGTLCMPTLEHYVLNWFEQKLKKGKEEVKSLARDLLPHRVGVTSISESDGYLVTCVPVSWAQCDVIRQGLMRELPTLEHFRILTVNCLLETSDEKFILALRSRQVIQYQKTWHVSTAGHVDLDSFLRKMEIADQIFVELEEELNLDPRWLESIEPIGLCEHPVFPSIYSTYIEVCYKTRTQLKSSEVIKRAKTARDAWEGKHQAFSQDEVQAMLTTETFHPAGAATLMMTLGIAPRF